MDESQYHRLVAQTFRRIEDALADVDPDKVDLDGAGDVLTLQLENGVRCVVNTQRPVRQIWVAARASAWHFGWDEASGRWISDKGTGEELFETLSRIVREHAGVDVTF